MEDLQAGADPRTGGCITGAIRLIGATMAIRHSVGFTRHACHVGRRHVGHRRLIGARQRRGDPDRQDGNEYEYQAHDRQKITLLDQDVHAT